jgi:CRISPR-associated Csx2 family protein
MARLFLSFVGTNNYMPCVYHDDKTQTPAPVGRFVQAALAHLHCQNWDADDRIVIFLTEAARSSNWEGANYANEPDFNEGLEKVLLNMQLRPAIHVETVPEGFDEGQVWAIFSTVFAQINEGDLIYLDITNAFRSIPAFTTVLVNYAELLKGARIQAIFYGIFEKLGPMFKVKTEIPNPTDRHVPIMHLTGLMNLQDWTSAANDFLTYGNAKPLSKMASAALKDNEAAVRPFSETADLLTGVFSTVRGKMIYEGDVFRDLRHAIERLETESPFEPLVPILEKLKNKLAPYQQNDILNGFRAIDWCIEHDLYQQAVTLMREQVVSFICHRNGLNFQHHKDRAIVEAALPDYKKSEENIRKSPYLRQKNIDPESVIKVLRDPMSKKLGNLYEDIRHFRNDFAHGGKLKNAKEPFEFVLFLRTRVHELKRLVEW